MKKTTQLWAFPKAGAYTSPLYDKLEKKGVLVKEGIWAFSWLKKNIKRQDIIHIHWPSFMYATSNSPIKTILNLIKFIVFVIYIKIKGGKIWWTAHNLLPHDKCVIRSFDIIARHIIIGSSENIFVHGSHARKQLEARFPKTKYKNIEIPHGNWIDYYGPVQDKAVAKELLSLPPNKTVLLIFGQLRAYKNIHLIIELIQQSRSSDVFLLIAGKFKGDKYKNQIEELIKQDDNNIRLDSKFIPNQDVPTYLAASDVMIMPYKEILTSGTAILAISYGLPVLSIKAGFLEDVITTETGIFISDISNSEIQAAIDKAKIKKWNKCKIIHHAEKFTYEKAAQTMFSQLTK